MALLQKLWTYSVTTKSDDARVYADEVAEAASRGFITTAIIPKGEFYGRLWKLTNTGTDFLFAKSEYLEQEEVRYVQDHTAD